MARILCRAASQFAFLPVIIIVSELLFSAGRSILVLLSSRICQKRKKKKVSEVSVSEKALDVVFDITTEQESKWGLVAGSDQNEH